MRMSDRFIGMLMTSCFSVALLVYTCCIASLVRANSCHSFIKKFWLIRLQAFTDVDRSLQNMIFPPLLFVSIPALVIVTALSLVAGHVGMSLLNNEWKGCSTDARRRTLQKEKWFEVRIISFNAMILFIGTESVKEWRRLCGLKSCKLVGSLEGSQKVADLAPDSSHHFFSWIGANILKLTDAFNMWRNSEHLSLELAYSEANAMAPWSCWKPTFSEPRPRC
jgi:hypothetical protein